MDVSGQLEMNDGESISLEYFSKNTLPKKLEKRAKSLIDALGEDFWKLEPSF